MENRIVPNRKQCNSCVHKSAIQDPAMEVDACHYYCSASPGDGPEGECIDGYYWDSGVCLCYKEKPRDLANTAGIRGMKETLSFEAKMDAYIECLGGIEAVKPYIPFSIEEIQKKLEMGKKLNFKTDVWVRAAGFEETEGEVFFVGGGITGLFWQKGIMDFSAAEGVCILKRAAERLARQAAGSGV